MLAFFLGPNFDGDVENLSATEEQFQQRVRGLHLLMQKRRALLKRAMAPLVLRRENTNLRAAPYKKK